MCLAYSVIAVTSGVVEYYTQSDNLHAQLTTRARSDAAILAAGAVASLNAGGTRASSVMQNFVFSIKRADGVKYAAIAANNTIVASTIPAERGRHVASNVLRVAESIQLANGDVKGRAPIAGELTDLGVAEVQISGSSVPRDLGRSVRAVLLVRLAGLIVFLLLSFAIARFMLGPLNDLVNTSRAIRRGEMDARVPEEGRTELQTVASAFNNMAAALQQRIRYLSFLATAGSTLPTAFREGSDIDPVLSGFCAELEATGAGLVLEDDSILRAKYWTGIPFSDARWSPLIADVLRFSKKPTEADDAYLALFIVPVPGDAAFVAVRKQPFSHEERQIITNFAYQFALAADNARLFAAQQEALQVKDQFLSIVSHELRTPLTTIKGYAQMLRRKLEDQPEDQRFAINIDAQVGRLSRLVDDLLDVTRFSRGQFELTVERTDIRPSLREVVSRFQVTAKQHTFRLELDEGSFEGEWDHGRLDQVLNNLVGNAVKYSPGGGEVTIFTQHVGSMLVVSVRDHGVGIDEDDLEQIFERFFRGQAQHTDIQGLGLGLYVTQRIVEAHGGKVSVRSVRGHGSEFSFSLPLLPDQPAR